MYKESKQSEGSVKWGLLEGCESRNRKRQRVDPIQNKTYTEKLKKCADILDEVMSHKCGWVFKVPEIVLIRLNSIQPKCNLTITTPVSSVGDKLIDIISPGWFYSMILVGSHMDCLQLEYKRRWINHKAILKNETLYEEGVRRFDHLCQQLNWMANLSDSIKC